MRARGLSKADQRLWAAFSQDLSLLPGKTRLALEPEPALPPAPAPSEPVKPKVKTAPPPVNIGAPPGGLDKSSWRKFFSGKTRTTRRLDLHGHTAARAHHAVTLFIEQAYSEGIRCVEIITGKGEVLALELPHWLNAPALRPLILAIAHPHAANTGAVRILLRKIR